MAKASTKAKVTSPKVFDCDLLIIGGGIAATEAAAEAAQLGKRVILIEAKKIGGGCLSTDAYPSKTLLEMARAMRDDGMDPGQEMPNMQMLLARANSTVESGIRYERKKLAVNQIETVFGWASFVDPYTVAVGARRITARKIIIATGSKPNRPDGIDFSTGHIIDSDGVFEMEHMPRSMIIVGGGIVGIEYAALFAAFGVRVTVVDRRPQLLGMCDDSISIAARYYMEQHQGVNFCLGEDIESCTIKGDLVHMKLKTGSVISAEKVLYAIGRHGVVKSLKLENAGLQANRWGRIEAINMAGQTNVDHIYAAGDVLAYAESMGVPSLTLASTAVMEGREAARHAFNPSKKMLDSISIPPVCIFSLPEIAFIGKTEGDMRKTPQGFVSGRVRYDEVAKGQILGEHFGAMRLIFAQDGDHKLLGAHIIGMRSSDIIGMAQVWIDTGATLEDIIHMNVAYPTLNGLYREAAFRARHELELTQQAA